MSRTGVVRTAALGIAMLLGGCATDAADIAAACHGPSSPLVQRASDHLQCVSRAARDLEAAAQPAPDVAVAASAHCQPTRAEALRVTAICRQLYISLGMVWAPGADLDQIAYTAAVEAVVSVRSARARLSPTH